MEYKSFVRKSGKSAANTDLTVSTEVGKKMLVDQIIVAYSASPTQTGVEVSLDSGLGSDYDAVLLTGSANTKINIFPTNLTKPIILMEDDVLSVKAPAGGGVITATITIIGRTL